MAANTPVGNVSKMVVNLYSQLDGSKLERTVGTGILPFPTATYSTIEANFRVTFNNPTQDTNLIRLTNDTWYDTTLITSISVTEQVAG